jgi:glycosyltransferase involved in cell wall biosynthesis
MDDQKLLTILMPVYNGEKFIGGLLDSFATFVKDNPFGTEFLRCCEILVINNCSEDRTLEIAQSFQGQLANLKIVTPDTHAPSAEQNVFRSLRLARGEYTWVLGVDDIVRFEALPEVLRIAREGRYDIAIFNWMLSDHHRVENVCNYYMKEPAYESDLVALTQRTGFWWLIAGFSGQMVRTARVANYDHAALVSKTSPIYSHVTAYLECLAGRPAAIVNIPNVIYRVVIDMPHFRRIAARLNVFDEFFWTLGYIRQLIYLEEKGIVPSDYVVKMIETSRNVSFRPTTVIYEKLLAQIELMGRTSDARNHLTRDEFEQVVSYFEKRDLLARPFFGVLRTMFDTLESGSSYKESIGIEARWRLQGYQANFLLAPNFSSMLGDYEIYHVADRYFAVHRLFRGAVFDRLRYLDGAEEAPILFEAKTRREVLKQIEERGIGMDLDKVPPVSMRYCSQPMSPGALAWHQPVLPQVPSYTPHSLGESALPAAQKELRAAYKGCPSAMTKVVAWNAAVWVKLAKRFLKAA